MAPSRLALRLRALFFRTLSSLLNFFDRALSQPGPCPHARPRFRFIIPSTISTIPGNIDLILYGPKSYQGKQSAPGPINGARRSLLPIVINFHGGGYTIGDPADDSRWATAVIESANPSTQPEDSTPDHRSDTDCALNTGAVMISVGYRLAPEYPYPTGIEDGVDAILWVWHHADIYGLDRTKIVLSGFSAGGNFTFTVLYRLHQELERRKQNGTLNLSPEQVGQIAGVISFYPGLDQTHTYEERRASNKAPNKPANDSIPAFMYDLFNKAYLYPPEALNLSDPCISPGLASDELIRNALPNHISLFTAGWDNLLVEGNIFRERLRILGKYVSGSEIPDEPHAFDKMPLTGKVNPHIDEMYSEAIRDLNNMLAS